jgi:hypothetical protein
LNLRIYKVIIDVNVFKLAVLEKVIRLVTKR